MDNSKQIKEIAFRINNLAVGLKDFSTSILRQNPDQICNQPEISEKIDQIFHQIASCAYELTCLKTEIEKAENENNCPSSKKEELRKNGNVLPFRK